ncbi:hypothetical protein EU527_01710 [Candidatus Thorarchaeota archaeon]|nr:MAG: hypothetical protein EU527_01710 [Candidatus Thorarchaeota archaeon]
MSEEKNYRRYLILLTIIIIYIIEGFIILSSGELDLYLIVVRFGALYGYASIFFATILSNFLREVRKIFGKPFMRVHHYFAIIGMISITIHPVVFSIYAGSFLVFIPDFSSWLTFWSLAGRPALYLAYIAVLASLLRMKIERYWRYLHGLMYVVLTFAFVHGYLIGANFTNPIIVILSLTMLFLAYGTGINRFLKKRKSKSKQS